MKSKLLGHSANDLFWFILPLLLPSLLDRYSLSYSQGGGILTIYLTITAAGSFIMGRLSDRYSPGRIISWGLIAASAGLALAGFAPTFPAFLVILAFTAIGVSTFHPVMYAVIDREYTTGKSAVMSYYETAGTVAILIMFLVNGFLLDKIGIKGVLIITALPAMGMGLYYLLSRKLDKKEARDAGENKDDEEADRAYLSRFLLFLLALILRVAAVSAVLNFLPTILTGYLGFSRASASYGSAFFFAGGIIGSLAAGRYSARFSPMTVLIAGTAMIMPAIISLTFPVPLWIHLATISIFGFFGSGCIISQNLLLTSMGRHLGKGEVFGILMGVMTLTSAFSPALFGFTVDTQGFTSALLLFSSPLILSTLVLALLNRKREEKSESYFRG